MTKKTPDWRIRNQMNYLFQKSLVHTKWFTNDDGDPDHDHCEFCAEKFSTQLQTAYCTTDYYHWICEQCYSDFKDSFEWVLEEEPKT